MEREEAVKYTTESAGEGESAEEWAVPYYVSEFFVYVTDEAVGAV